MEEPGEDALGVDEPCAGQAPAAKQVPTEAVLDGERVAIHTVSGLELALEVGGPDGVGGIEWGRGLTGVWPPPAPSSLLHQSAPKEVVMKRPLQRDLSLWKELDELGADLSGAEGLTSAVADPDRLFKATV